jgi:hypothetical protein
MCIHCLGHFSSLLPHPLIIFYSYVESHYVATRCDGTNVIPALGRLRQEDCEFEASMSYRRPCLKKEEEKPGGVAQ